ncbi:MMPL family transporter [Rubrobacter indicoceani]|uniref:MMPL family transporter n=1 Tax=Rubrobacter indicoceani TaxID=2051957 RepID=UPI000E5BE9C5|nr:MMPL family transporter [Rubrobacter indicoceani]
MQRRKRAGFFGVLGWVVGRGGPFVVGLWVAAAVFAYLYLPPLDDRITGNVSDLVSEPEDFVSGAAGSFPSSEAAPEDPPERATGGSPDGGAPDGGTPPEAAPPGVTGDGSPVGEAPVGEAPVGEAPVGPGSGGVPTATDDEAGLSGVVEAPAMLVFTSPGGIGEAELSEVYRRLGRFEAERPYRLASAVPVPPGGEAAGSVVVLLFFEAGISPTGIGTGTEEARRIASPGAGDISVEATGTAPAQNDAADAIERRLPVVTAATLSVIFIILALTYRSPVAPLVPLLSIGLSAFLTLRLLAYFATRLDVQIPSQVEPVILVLVFGVGTDYALFVLSRTRQALASGLNRSEAAREGLVRSGPVVVSSAAVLIASFMVLAGAELEVYRTLGPGLALSLLVVTVVTLTLVPALLALLGRSAFGRSGERGPRGITALYVRVLGGRPGIVAGAVVAGLVVLAVGAAGLRVGFDQVGALPDDAPSARGYEALARNTPAGVLSPVNVIVTGESLARLTEEERAYRLERLQSAMWATGGYAAVLGPGSSLPGVEFLAGDGSSARFVLVTYGSPFSPEALDDGRELQAGMPGLLDGAGLSGLDVQYGGQSVLAGEARAVSGSDLGRLAPLVFGVAFAVIAVLLRTPVAPVYLLLSTALGFAATLGVATVFFQGVLGEADVVYYVPFALFLLLVALGSDYNIFIMSAIREEASDKPLSEAVPDAVSGTGETINAAGLALAASFALLALIPLSDFRQIGLTVALGVLLDTFVIRPLLVPALVLLFGRLGFWPSSKVSGG